MIGRVSRPLAVSCVQWFGIAALLGACGGPSGTISGPGGVRSGHAGAGGAEVHGAGARAAPAAGSGGASVPITAPTDPYPQPLALSAGRKVKTLLTGMNITDAEVQKLQTMGAAGMQELIGTWTTDATFAPMFRDKMLFFFRNSFQQIGFQPTEDFKMQLLQNGGFDFGGFGTRILGGDAYLRLVQNIQDSFAMTAWQLVTDGRPMIETLTTQRYMMTTGMKSLYLQIEAPNDRQIGRNAPAPLAWKVDYSGNPIPLEQTLDPTSPNYLVFDDQAPPNPAPVRGGSTMFQTCQGGTAVDADGAAVTQGMFTGQSRLFQRLLGFTPRFPFSGTPTCYEHGSKPYFTDDDLSDWQWVNTRPLNDGETQPRAFDLPLLRTLKELPLKLPRMGFYTTPAFLALWNTNDSNQHRVTANQTLLVALGRSFTSADTVIPLSTMGLDADHAVDGWECYGCHKSLDPMRGFWGNQYDFNDRNDFPTRGIMMTAPNPRPSALGGVFAFMDVNKNGASMLDFGGLLASVSDGAMPEPLNTFAQALTQKLCFYANSAQCDPRDPEFRRVALAFQHADYDFHTLFGELFASPLVTGAGATMTFAQDQMPVSISRRDHFCGALSQRLGKPDLCALAVALPSNTQAATARLAATVPADAFSRGSEIPITPSQPTLFHRAAVEMLCENIAGQVVDAMSGGIYSSSDAPGALTDFVDKVMDYPPSDPHRAQALQILTDHYNAVKAQGRNASTNALRSAFVLACESPSSVGIGL
jgi:hypothetical protein